ncbi:hypothetical protein [Streptomyces nigra]|uniref:hypothetical protein n=1 Tax=Streptomyces nigra TaxID=1827580 RepID=UPI0036325154
MTQTVIRAKARSAVLAADGRGPRGRQHSGRSQPVRRLGLLGSVSAYGLQRSLVVGKEQAGDSGGGTYGIVGNGDAVRLVDADEAVGLETGVVRLEAGYDELVRVQPDGR